MIRRFLDLEGPEARMAWDCVCDACGCETEFMFYEEDALRAHHVAEGWTVTDDRVLCPDCREGSE